MKCDTKMLLVSLLFANHLRAVELDPSKLPPAAQTKVDFARDIQPVFEKTCWRCHGPERPKSHFRLDNRESALKGGDNGVDILPGDSAHSPLIHYIARLVPDLEMPPEGKGEPLTSAQVGLFRAWVDQSAPWGTTNSPVQFAFSAAPTLRWVAVDGNKSKFREVEGIREGFSSGLEHFSLEERLGPDKKFSVEGRALFPDNDFQIKLSLGKAEFGFVHAGFEQWRRYYDDTGGYYQPFAVPSFDLHRDLHLDLGRAWIDFGVTLPHWPQIVVGYEYQFKDGAKSLLEWGNVNGKNIYPAAENIHEHVHIVKFDLTHEFSGWWLEDSARVEFYDSRTRHDDALSFSLGPAPDSLVRTRYGFTHIQGMNAVRVERQVTDWWLVSGGYLYSKLQGDASLNQATVDAAGIPTFGFFWSSDQIELERETHSFSVSSLLLPAKDLSLSLGVQPEWVHQESLGKLHFDEGDPSLPQFFLLQPATLDSELDTRKVSEQAGLRFTKIPWTVLFGEGRWEQQHIGQSEEQMGEELLLSGHPFERDTDFSNERQQYRAGFSTSPWSAISLSAEYKTSFNDSTYHNHKIALESEGYSAFIRARTIDTDAVQTKLSVRPAQWLRLTLTYQLVATDFHTATAPVSGDISPGGNIFAGNYDAHIYGINATIMPWQRLYFSGAFTYSDARTVTAQNGDPSVVPYRGDVFTLFGTASYALDQATDLKASYSFSRASFGQNNVVDGLPLGLDYTRHGVMAGVTRRLTSSLTGNLRYAFYHYAEPSTGGLNDYTAHGVFATLMVKWP